MYIFICDIFYVFYIYFMYYPESGYIRMTTTIYVLEDFRVTPTLFKYIYTFCLYFIYILYKWVLPTPFTERIYSLFYTTLAFNCHSELSHLYETKGCRVPVYTMSICIYTHLPMYPHRYIVLWEKDALCCAFFLVKMCPMRDYIQHLVCGWVIQNPFRYEYRPYYYCADWLFYLLHNRRINSLFFFLNKVY